MKLILSIQEDDSIKQEEIASIFGEPAFIMARLNDVLNAMTGETLYESTMIKDINGNITITEN
jgi:hypothetical protein